MRTSNASWPATAQPWPGKFSEGTLLVAQLKIYVRQAVIDQAQMTDVGGTMDLAIVRNNCGTITVARHRNVSGKSVNETLGRRHSRAGRNLQGEDCRPRQENLRR
jgi:hypothetical protein